MSIIPIKNIYYMLCYAYDVLKQGENINLDKEEFHNVYDLFAMILYNGIIHLVKRGFIRGYISLQEDLYTLRGKIDVNECAKKQTNLLGKIPCFFDEMSQNIMINRIIKASLVSLINSNEISPVIKERLANVSKYFSSIENVRICKSCFTVIQYNRNNTYYKMILDICELLYDELLVSSQTSGKSTFKDFIQDVRMATLYEKFILNFYKKELTQCAVYSPILSWMEDDIIDQNGENYLPVMRTDVVIESNRKQLIIDTKYYTNALKIRNYGETKKLISSHLYQIYAYVTNSSYRGEISGMLLYPVVDENIDLFYGIQGRKIHVKTINLNTSWNEIYSRLISIASVL